MMNEGEMCGAVVPWYERSGVDGCDDGSWNHREVRLAQLETQAVIQPVRVHHWSGCDVGFGEAREGD